MMARDFAIDRCHAGSVRGRGQEMYERQKEKDGSPVFRFRMNGAAVTVMFSESGMPGVKERVRDILTESYEERFHDKVQALARQQ